MKSTLLALSLATAPMVAAASSHDQTGVIHVTASASVDAAPDIATVSAGVQSQADTAKNAMALNSDKMRQVYQALQNASVNPRDIATSSLNLRPEYDYSQNRSQPRITGYMASNQITVTTRDLDVVGGLIDALLDAGLNNIQNVQFSLDDTEAAMAKARRMAVEKARDKAETMAGAAGVELGRLLVLTEGSRPGAMPQFSGAMAMRVEADAAPPLSPGQRELSATVTLSYAID